MEVNDIVTDLQEIKAKYPSLSNIEIAKLMELKLLYSILRKLK